VIIILLCVLALILAILWTCIFKRTKQEVERILEMK